MVAAERLTRGTKANTRNTADKTKVAAEAPTRAFVPWTSKCCGQRGNHHGFEDCCLLKMSRVWADVPRVAMLRAAQTPIMTAWAMWRGAGLIFMFVDVA
jgi:hypothetical protein